MWDQLTHLTGALSLRTISDVDVSTDLKWLSIDGGEEIQSGAYPLYERRGTVELSDALFLLRRGFAMRCVAAPTEYLVIGNSYYTPEVGAPWYRSSRQGGEWRQFDTNSFSGDSLLKTLSGWDAKSRWCIVLPPKESVYSS